MPGDYYKTLGVDRNSSKDDLKQAYRRLARKYHPDVNKEAGAEERFKEINRAYEVLSEPDTRSRYDQFGEAGVSGANGFNQGDMGDMGGFADIFETIFSGFGGGAGTSNTRRRNEPTKGDDLRLDLKLNFREAIFGGEKEIRIPHLEICTVCQGSGAKPGTQKTTCPTCDGQGQVRRSTRTPFGSFAQVSTCPTCNGEGQIIKEKCEVCGGAGRRQVTEKVKITIPAGVGDGTRLRVSRKGDAGLRGGVAGDLYVYLYVESDKVFTREKMNILSEIKISYLQAILGCTVSVDTVDGKKDLSIPSGTQPRTILTLDNLGVPKLGNDAIRGDHLITVNVDIPTRINSEERELLEKLAVIKCQTHGKGGIEGFLGSLFNK